MVLAQADEAAAFKQYQQLRMKHQRLQVLLWLDPYCKSDRVLQPTYIS